MRPSSGDPTGWRRRADHHGALSAPVSKMEMAMITSDAGVLVVAMVGLIQAAHVQVTLELVKVTCDQWAGYKITNPQNIALWISGYFNGKRGNTVIDTQGLAAENQKLRDFCITH